ncbi:MAG: DNA mismatch repair protein MutS [Polyangiaceae bacterium]
MAKGKDASATPVMLQFRAAKDANPDALVFFRMGDFYELFYEDAVVASRALDLTLTSRNKGAEDAIPMAGVPHHAASSYVQRLTEQGFRVAICEQMADPKTVKGIVPRDVVRVVSPGVAFDDASLPPRENLFMAAVVQGPHKGTNTRAKTGYGIAAFDLSTGELFACEVVGEEAALAELTRLDPREVVADADTDLLVARFQGIRPRSVRPRKREGEAEPLDTAIFRCDSALATRAAAWVFEAAMEAEPKQKPVISTAQYYTPEDRLVLDEATQRHLELCRAFDGDTRGSLLSHIDTTVTTFGARLLRRHLLSPLCSVTAIDERLDRVELFVTQPGLRRDVRARLSNVADLERLALKLRYGRALPRDLASLRAALRELGPLSEALGACPDLLARAAIFRDLDLCKEPLELLERALADDPALRLGDGPVLRAGYDAELDEAQALLENGQERVTELERSLREKAQAPSLKVRFTRVFGWYIEVSRGQASRVPADFRRKQTVATGERYSCDALDVLADKLLHAEELARAREGDLYRELVTKLAEHAARYVQVAHTLAAWDVASSLADIAHRHDYVRPTVDDSRALSIREGRHPVVERTASLGRFVPNDCMLDAKLGAEEGRMWLITGPNMAGKSTFMRQVALIVLLAQMGSFVPAKSAAIGVVDRLLTRVGASDNLSKGESTFMVEMKETANVLRCATGKSLVILDEIGRGTSTYDGLSIAWAVAEYLHDVSESRALFATHYHELTELPRDLAGVRNYSVTAREHGQALVFLHALKSGAASRSYGVACAKLAGLPEPVLSRARDVLSQLERGESGKGLGKGGPAKEAPQLDLFAGTAPHAVITLLKELDIERLTPIEALLLLSEWKKKV